MFHRNTGAANELPCIPEFLQWPLPDILGGETKTAINVDIPLENSYETVDEDTALRG